MADHLLPCTCSSTKILNKKSQQSECVRVGWGGQVIICSSSNLEEQETDSFHKKPKTSCRLIFCPQMKEGIFDTSMWWLTTGIKTLFRWCQTITEIRKQKSWQVGLSKNFIHTVANNRGLENKGQSAATHKRDYWLGDFVHTILKHLWAFYGFSKQKSDSLIFPEALYHNAKRTQSQI